MDGRNCAEIAFKVWGVMLLADVLASIPSTVLFLWADPGTDPDRALYKATQFGTVFALLSWAILGLSLLLWGHVIAQSFIPITPRLRVQASYAQLQAVGFGIVGVIILVAGLQDAVAAAITLHTQPYWIKTNNWYGLWSLKREEVLNGVVQISCGIGLIFGRERIVQVISRSREISADK